MMQNEALKSYFTPYSRSELLFREVYFAKQDPEQLRALLASKPPKVQNSIKNWLLAEQGIILSEMTENLENVDFRDNIIVTRHDKYTPAFIHKHTFFEMIYVFEGSIINKIGETELVMKAGDFCLLPPGIYHCLKDTNDSIVINILLKHYVANTVLSGLLEQKNVLSGFFIQSLYMTSNNRYLLFHTQGNRRLHTLIENLAEEDLLNKDFVQDEQHNAVKESLLNLIFNYLARYHAQDTECDEIILTDSHLIVEIQNYLISNVNSTTLQSLAKHFNYSPSYLSRFIQQTTGTNFSKILRRIKINKACSLLHNTSLSINEIGEQIGYSSQRQFNRAFRDITCMTPSEYRKQHKLYVF